MKKNPTQAQPPATEEDAAWWLQNRKLLDKELRAAIQAGETITAEELRRRIEASKQRRAPMVALRIPEADLTLARKQAKQKGLPYQTYIKSLLHQALAECEKRDEGPKKTKRR
jgi:predicted DNA binding CopG/RHH family protein